jgi:enoyl-CoA hydratase
MVEDVLVEDRDRIRVITLNRPDARNAFNRSMSRGVADAIDELDARDDLTAGVITGAGGIFSAGMDLKAFLAGEEIAVPDRGLAGITSHDVRKPLIAAVEGWALAGGFEVALACDLIVASETAKFGIPEVKRGLIASGGGLIRLPLRIPQALATEMALTGEPITAQQAQQYGLVNALTQPGEALAGALSLAEKVVANGPLAVSASKAVILATQQAATSAATTIQKSFRDQLFASEDAKEGARAFAEKRKPVWQGR